MKLYNTMSRSKEEFASRNGKTIKMFTCGPSVYRRPHIGNYRTFLYEDMLLRYLEYKGYTIQRVINFTDMEDKTIEEAAEHDTSPQELTARVKNTFFSETEQLGIKLPDHIPSSESSVKEAVELIQQLVKKGFAYRHGDDFFFDPLQKHDFGKLYKLDMSNWPKKKIRFKKDTYPGNRWNRGDFILWHGAQNGDSNFWDTEIGKGRPSWNIQDPAMIYQQLGLTIDINCGGIDNIIRHHDYNIAIMEALSGKDFAKYYLHGEHLLVDGKKMSKSVGNILHIEDVVGKDGTATELRYFLLAKHYRKKLNFTKKAFAAKRRELQDINKSIQALLQAGDDSSSQGHPAAEIKSAFEDCFDDDLQFGSFFHRLQNVILPVYRNKTLNKKQAKELEHTLHVINDVVGVFSF